jgi:hypothetical protein
MKKNKYQLHSDNNAMADILGSVSDNPSNNGANTANGFSERAHGDAAVEDAAIADAANDFTEGAGEESDRLPTDNFESGSADGRMIFADGDVILYTPDNGNPLPGIVIGFDGTKYDIKLDNGTKMTVDERCLVRCNHPGDTSASPFGSSNKSESSNEGIKMKTWQYNANCANSDSETETEIDDAPKFCKGQWVWYRQDDEELEKLESERQKTKKALEEKREAERAVEASKSDSNKREAEKASISNSKKTERALEASKSDSNKGEAEKASVSDSKKRESDDDSKKGEQKRSSKSKKEDTRRSSSSSSSASSSSESSSESSQSRHRLKKR